MAGSALVHVGKSDAVEGSAAVIVRGKAQAVGKKGMKKKDRGMAGNDAK